MSADTYVISIYRRSGESGTEVAGLAECAGTGERKAFSNSTELWAFLSSTSASPPTKTKRERTAQKKP